MKPFRFLPDSLDEILFERRNKEYGAYELRKSYHKRVIQSFPIALSILLLLFGTPFLLQCLEKKPTPQPEIFASIPVDLKQNFELQQKQIEPLIAHQGQRTSPNPEFLVTPDSLLSKVMDKKDTIQIKPDLTTSTNNNLGHDTTAHGELNDTTGSGGHTAGTNTAFIASSSPFSLASVDKTPQFPGGDQSMMNFFQKNIHFSALAREAGISGRVYASFIINSKGEVEAIKIIRSLGSGLDEEVVRVLGIMPKWEPGYYQGRPVSTILNIPVSFNLIQ